jgi:hypothetical protein
VKLEKEREQEHCTFGDMGFFFYNLPHRPAWQPHFRFINVLSAWQTFIGSSGTAELLRGSFSALLPS